MARGEVLSICECGERTVTLTVACAGEDEPRSFTVGSYAIEKLGSPELGRCLSSDECDYLAREHERREAYRAAVRILEYGDNNRRGLIGKLRARGFSPEISKNVTDRMTELGYIRESEQVSRLVLGLARRNLWGPRRLRAELIAKGYEGADVDAAIDRAISSGEIDFADLRERLLSKKKETDPRRRYALLYRYGYGGEDGED